MPKISFKRILKSILTIGVMVYVGFGILLVVYQRSFIYFPTKKITDTNEVKMTFRSGDETINAWVVNPGHADATIFFGGNAVNAYLAIPQVKRTLPNFTSYLVDYRGYGSSSGTPSETALLADALVVHDAIALKHRTVTAVGRSLGTGIAAFLAARRDLHKLVLITPYDSIEAVAKHRYPVYPIATLLKDKFDTLSLVPDISEKTLILIAEYDRVVPVEHAHRLASAFNTAQLEVKTIANTSHNSISQQPIYESLIRDFISKDTNK